MKAESKRAERPQGERPSRRPRPKTVAFAVIVAGIGVMAALLAASRPNGATYEEYLRLKQGMRRDEVATIVGEADYWHHAEADKDVTSWVNKDGTYIKTVFDRNDVLVDFSWESGWDPAREKVE